MACKASPEFLAAVHRISQEPEFADFTIICEGASYKVSRMFISAHSPYFKKACMGAFKARSHRIIGRKPADMKKEGLERKITLHEDEPEAVGAMIQFFREHEYKYSGADPLSLHVSVFTVADKYEVTDLKELALENLTASLLALSREDLPGLLVPVTKSAWTSALTDARIREFLLRQWCLPEVAKSTAAQLVALVDDCPDFGTDLILVLAASREVANEDIEKLVLDHVLAMPRGRGIKCHTVARETKLVDTVVRCALEKLTADGKIQYDAWEYKWYWD